MRFRGSHHACKDEISEGMFDLTSRALAFRFFETREMLSKTSLHNFRLLLFSAQGLLGKVTLGGKLTSVLFNERPKPPLHLRP